MSIRPDYMEPGYIFSRPCQWCWKSIEWTKESGVFPADWLCSDKCREDSAQAILDTHRNNFARAMGSK